MTSKKIATRRSMAFEPENKDYARASIRAPRLRSIKRRLRTEARKLYYESKNRATSVRSAVCL